jgi:hypothetical protein
LKILVEKLEGVSVGKGKGVGLKGGGGGGLKEVCGAKGRVGV